MITELATCHDRFRQFGEPRAIGQQGGHLCQQRGVANCLGSPQRVSQQLGSERTVKLGLLRPEIAVQRSDIGDGGSVAEFSGGFDRFSITIAIAPTAQRVVVFQGKTEWVNPRMTVDTGDIATVCCQALTDRESVYWYVIGSNGACISGRWGYRLTQDLP